MNKSQIRKKILKIRKQKKTKKFIFNFDLILNFLKKKKVHGKIIGGYYPYNYEIDILQILVSKKIFLNFILESCKTLTAFLQSSNGTVKVILANFPSSVMF